MKDESFQIDLLRMQAELHRNLRNMKAARKVLIYGLRATAQLLDATEAGVATLDETGKEASMLFSIPKKHSWDLALLKQFLLDKRPAISHDTLLAPVRRRERNWAVLALRREDAPFSRLQHHALFSIAQLLTETVHHVDRERLIRVRRKIERRIANREDPKDLMYNILHGLQTLTLYDHSASLFITRPGSDTLELVAEKIAWIKAKSRQIGRRIRIADQAAQRLRDSGVTIYQRDGEAWYPLLERTDGTSDINIPQLLASDKAMHPSAPLEQVMLCVPIQTPDGALSILKIAACRPDVLGAYEAELVDGFMPLVSLVVQFAGQIESLRGQVLRAERKHVLADMARATAHDVNHALGTILPRVQALHHELRMDSIDPVVLKEDLQDIEASVQTCRRIFEGMLSVARETNRGLGHGNVRRAIEQALSVLQDRLKRKTVDVHIDLPEELPAIRGRQGDITRLFLNLCGNAIDALEKGGQLRIVGESGPDTLKVMLEDDGRGIPESIKHKVMEPFFSGKKNGSGLGLAICRSILREMGGEIEIESKEGTGTRVFLVMPSLEESLLEVL